MRVSVALSEGETLTYIRSLPVDYFIARVLHYFVFFCVSLDVSLIASRGELMRGNDVIRF